MYDFSQVFIVKAWLIIGCFLVFIAMVGNYKITRYASYTLFFLFIFLSSLRSINFNNDIVNYINHYQTMTSTTFGPNVFVAWLFEPGYNLVVFILSRFCDSKFFLFFITILPGILLVYTFSKYNYRPQVVAFIHATIILVAASTTIRHYWALAVGFWLINLVLSESHRVSTIFYTLPAFFHFSSLSLVSILLFDKYKNQLNVKRLLVLFVFMLLLIVLLKPFWSIIIGKLVDRASLSELRGLRNIQTILIISMLLLTFRNTLKDIAIVPGRMNFLLWMVIIISFIMLPFPGLNRVTSFFVLILCYYLNIYFVHRKLVCHDFLLNLFSFLSIIYFFKYWGGVLSA